MVRRRAGDEANFSFRQCDEFIESKKCQKERLNEAVKSKGSRS